MPEQRIENNEELARRLYDGVVNTGRVERLADIMAPTFEGPTGEKGPEGFAATVTMLRTGFPDLQFTIEDVVATPDRVVVRWKWTGTHEGMFRGFPPTGTRVHDTGISMYEVTDGKFSRAWIETDRLGMLQQLGVVPGLDALRSAAAR